METFFKAIIVTLFVALNISCNASPKEFIASGQQPQIAIDNSGNIRIIYGNGDKIYCATSVDDGLTFSDIQLIGEVKEMHLGMTRGPQIASSENYTLVSANDKKGDIHIFEFEHKSGKWKKTSLVNDISGSAPEGLMSITADQNDNFYAVWLDTRNDKKNKICFASTTDKGFTWSKNKIVYKSPDQTVCECCKPSIVASESQIFIMFRNWLNGSRDLYLSQSKNNGGTFIDPVKLGNGTWKLNACPMDGGGLVVSENNNVLTVWQRDGKIYLAKPNEAEKQIGIGRSCSITDPENPIITWQDGNNLKVKELNENKESEVSEGNYIKAIRTKDDKILYVWEAEGTIMFKKV